MAQWQQADARAPPITQHHLHRHRKVLISPSCLPRFRQCRSSTLSFHNHAAKAAACEAIPIRSLSSQHRSPRWNQQRVSRARPSMSESFLSGPHRPRKKPSPNALKIHQLAQAPTHAHPLSAMLALTRHLNFKNIVVKPTAALPMPHLHLPLPPPPTHPTISKQLPTMSLATTSLVHTSVRRSTRAPASLATRSSAAATTLRDTKIRSIIIASRRSGVTCALRKRHSAGMTH